MYVQLYVDMVIWLYMYYYTFILPLPLSSILPPPLSSLSLSLSLSFFTSSYPHSSSIISTHTHTHSWQSKLHHFLNTKKLFFKERGTDHRPRLIAYSLKVISFDTSMQQAEVREKQ